MDNWLVALLLKPFAALALFMGSLLIARWLFPLIPDGRIKWMLYDRTIRQRYPWRFALGFMALAWGGMGLVALLVL